MIVTLASVKGGVGKSTCAIHIAAYLRSLSSTLLVDSDRIRSCVAWNKRGKLPFPVVDENHQAKAMRDTRYEYVVFDTPGSIDDQGLMELADGCDLMIVSGRARIFGNRRLVIHSETYPARQGRVRRAAQSCPAQPAPRSD